MKTSILEMEAWYEKLEDSLMHQYMKVSYASTNLERLRERPGGLGKISLPLTHKDCVYLTPNSISGVFMEFVEHPESRNGTVQPARR